MDYLIYKILPLTIFIVVWYRENKSKHKAIKLLRDLTDLHNGLPLVSYQKEWEETMNEVYDFLNEHE